MPGEIIDFTVAIPTYNGAKRLPDVLDRLKTQTGVEGISWEVIIVNNNSSDSTQQVVGDYQNRWLPNVCLRYYFEPKQGLAFARQRLVEEALGEFVGFLDDDNWPAPNWVIEALKFGRRCPNVGAYGSNIEGKLEVEPPKYWNQVKAFLVVRNYGNNPILLSLKTSGSRRAQDLSSDKKLG